MENLYNKVKRMIVLLKCETQVIMFLKTVDFLSAVFNIYFL